MTSRVLLAVVASVLLLAELGCTPSIHNLNEAAAEGKRSAAQRYIERGADINAPTEGSSWTPLHWAAFNGHDEMVAFLIENGANVDARDAKGNTPLHLAAGKGHEETVAELIGAGADQAARNNKGETPLDFAAGHEDVEQMLREAEWFDNEP